MRFLQAAILLAGLLLAPSFAAAAVSGTVMNKTTSQPQAGALVSLYRLGKQGMEPIKTVKSDAQGAFRIDQDIQGPHLVQTIYGGVVYTQMIPPGTPTENLELDVYSATSKKDEAKVSQHMVLIEPMEGILHVNESIIVSNAGNRTYNDSKNGTVRIYLPPEVEGTPRLTATSPGSMPVQRDLVKTKTKGVYAIDFPIKPGDTQFDLTYVLPEADPQVLSGKILHGGGSVRLIVPRGVTLTGDAIKEVGEEPRTHAKVYGVSGSKYSVTIEGTGTLRAPETPAGGGAGIQAIRPRIYSHFTLIFGLALLILSAGFLLLYRRPWPAPGGEAAAPVKPRGKRK